jgi:hypothetical protein
MTVYEFRQSFFMDKNEKRFTFVSNYNSKIKYPRKLSSGANNTVIVLDDTEVAKLF